MTITETQKILRDAVIAAARSQFDVELEQVVAEIPPKTELGDLAFPVAFELAKKIKQATGEKKNPRELAETLKGELETINVVGRVEVAGAGYLNVFLDRAAFLSENAAVEPLPNRELSIDAASTSVGFVHNSVNQKTEAQRGKVAN